MTHEIPCDLEMEKFVLSALLMKNGEAVPVAAAILTEGDFYRPEHRILYRAILEIYDSGEIPNVLTLIEALKRTGELEKIGHTLIYSLTEYAHTTAYVEGYAKAIKEKATLRQLIETSEVLQQEAYKAAKPASEIIADAEEKLFSLYRNEHRAEFEPLKPILMRTFDEIRKLMDNRTRISGVGSGFRDLDDVTNGFQKSDLILIAARPSMGKTAFALNIAANAAINGSKVAIFSLEMSKRQLGRRLLAAQSRIDSSKVQTGNITATEFGDLMDALEILHDKEIYIDDSAGLRVSELRQKARRLKLEKDIDAIIIDYLQLMQAKSKGENRQQEISEISRSLKALARELDVPIIALSQLSRSPELRADKRPLLSDLRESGALEQDADIVMFLYREEYYDPQPDNENLAELIIAKNRNGATKTINLYFYREIMKFEPVNVWGE